MGLMDKAKQAAAQASQIAQTGIEQGQARLDQVQGKQNLDALMRGLGEAFYAEQRRGGSHDAVVAALGAIDQHLQQHPAAGGPTGSTSSGPGAPPPGSAGPGASGAGGSGTVGGTGPGGTPSGNFTLDDL